MVSTPAAASETEPELPSLSALTAPRAEESPDEYEWPDLSLSLGAQLVADVNTVLRVDSETLGEGTEIDLEDELDLDDSALFGRIDANWRMAKRHELDFSIFVFNREGTRVIDEEIQIGDEIFTVNAEVESEFDTLVIKLAYRYAFLYRPRWHMGASLGAHTMEWKSKWTAGALAAEEEFDVLAPLPVLGLFGSYAFTPKLYLNGSTEFFGLEYEEFDGFMNNTRLDLEHRTFEHVALGLGVDYFLIDAAAESENGHLSAEAEHDYLGLLAIVRIY